MLSFFRKRDVHGLRGESRRGKKSGGNLVWHFHQLGGGRRSSSWWRGGGLDQHCHRPGSKFKRHLNCVSPESFFQGGLDDYFLSGSQTCSDGAESCPDTTKVTKLCDWSDQHDARVGKRTSRCWTLCRGTTTPCWLSGRSSQYWDLDKTNIWNPGVLWRRRTSTTRPSSRHIPRHNWTFW